LQADAGGVGDEVVTHCPGDDLDAIGVADQAVFGDDAARAGGDAPAGRVFHAVPLHRAAAREADAAICDCVGERRPAAEVSGNI